jgi:hypothetical protein
MSAAKQTTVPVDGEQVDIWVVKDGRVTWRAWGDFRGNHFDATGSSESNAKDRWQQKADYIAKG